MSTSAVCLSFDFDAVSVWLKSRNPSERSRGEFGAVAVPRILHMLQERDIPATFFVTGHTATVGHPRDLAGRRTATAPAACTR